MIAIDLGSNTLRVVEMDCESGERVNAYEKVVRTAKGLVTSGIIADENIQRVTDALHEAQQVIDFSKHTVKAVTTEAIRRASNGDDVLAMIKEKTDVLFSIITGEEEATFTLNAVQKRLHKLHIDADSFVLFDLGGGSTELTFVQHGTVTSKSFPVGIVTLAEKYQSFEAMENALDDELQALKYFTQSFTQISSFIATAGTPTTLAAFKQGQNYANYDYKKVNGSTLNTDDIEMLFQKLLAMESNERALWVGVGRSDLIIAGVIIFKKILEITGFKETTVIDDGLREGVALGMCTGYDNS